MSRLKLLHHQKQCNEAQKHTCVGLCLDILFCSWLFSDALRYCTSGSCCGGTCSTPHDPTFYNFELFCITILNFFEAAQKSESSLD